MTLTFGSLFAGIGGIDLGLERAGMTCRWQVEIDPFCRRVLEKHWPGVPKYGDIRELKPSELERVDVVAGGFPCQPVSVAGRKGGEADGRWLWPEFLSVIRAVRPRWVLVENVPGLLSTDVGRLFGNILRDLAKSGYDAEWEVLGACAFGAPMHRERVWLLAYPHDAGLQGPVWAGEPIPAGQEWPAAHREPLRPDSRPWPPGPGAVSDVPRMADGPTDRVDRLRALGNAVVPQVVEYIGRRIVEVA